MLAIKITRIFEGSEWGSINTYDAGGISYGFIQFTLTGGSLFRVLSEYENSDYAQYAGALKPYILRVMHRDLTLKNEQAFLDLLYDAADDIVMQDAQLTVATNLYWLPVLNKAKIYNLTLPLSYCYVFDASVRLGPNNENLAYAMLDLNIAGNADPTEQELIIRAIKRARDEMYQQAARENLPGLKVRANFWTVMATSDEDWQMRGDNGYIVVKDGPMGTVNALT